jgi:DNA repair protein RadC
VAVHRAFCGLAIIGAGVVQASPARDTELAHFRCTWTKRARARFPSLRPSEAFDPPSDRLIRCGVDALGAEELIALIFQRGQRGEGGLECARRLARAFGSISRLGRAGPQELSTLSGITPEEAAALVSSFRLGRLATSDPVPSRLLSAADVAAVAMQQLASATRERAIVLVCDGANHLRNVVPVSEGSIDRAFLPVREVLNAVLRNDGRAFAVAHNHPSGDATPGMEDLRATNELRVAARTVGLRFLDHVVIAGDRWARVSSTRRTSD